MQMLCTYAHTLCFSFFHVPDGGDGGGDDAMRRDDDLPLPSASIENRSLTQSCARLKGKPEKREERGRKEVRTTFETDRYETAEGFTELAAYDAATNSATERGSLCSRNRAPRDDATPLARSWRRVTCGCLILGWLSGGI